MLTGSRFLQDDSLKNIAAISRTKIGSLSAQVTMNRRTAWLNSNYDKIFRKVYPSAVSSKLSRPQVSFIKTDGNSQIFNITCLEKSQGSAYRLDLNYQYNLASGKWSIYSGQL